MSKHDLPTASGLLRALCGASDSPEADTGVADLLDALIDVVEEEQDDPTAPFLRSLLGKAVVFAPVSNSAVGSIEYIDFSGPQIEPFLESKIFDEVNYPDFAPILPLHDPRLASVHNEFFHLSGELEADAWWDSLPLPFDHSVFEFRMNGFRVALFVNGPLRRIAAIVEAVKGLWYPLGVTTPQGTPRTMQEAKCSDPNVDPLTDAFGYGFGEALNVVYAASVTLDIGVASADLAEAPRKLNKARQKRGKAPLRDYHIIRLHPKYVAHRDPAAPESDIRRAIRMHAVRGHWRHLGDEKRTWIKWHFRGDPALGFVRKHYET